MIKYKAEYQGFFAEGHDFEPLRVYLADPTGQVHSTARALVDGRARQITLFDFVDDAGIFTPAAITGLSASYSEALTRAGWFSQSDVLP